MIYDILHKILHVVTSRCLSLCEASSAPATVGGIKPGCLRIGNTGGMLDNIVMSRLYRPGSVAYVSKSGGMCLDTTCDYVIMRIYVRLYLYTPHIYVHK